MDNKNLRIPLCMCNLQKSTSLENTNSALKELYNVIISYPEELDLFYSVGGSNLVLSYMRDDRLLNICLKILANAAKKDERIRKSLQKSEIFYFLSVQLKKEKNFSNNNIILYATTIVILVLNNEEAQNQMRNSGCLDCLIHTLNCILDCIEKKPVSRRNIEVVIYAIATSIKNPQNSENQTQIGWILPKILDFVSKQSLFVNVYQNHVLKCFWSLIRAALDQNDNNQEIFIKCSGAIVVFRSLQDILDDQKFEELGDLAIKLTGVLVKMKSQKEFLRQSSNYCSLTILRIFLKTNNSLVIRNIVTFLNSLAQEIPQALNVVMDEKIMKRMKRILGYSKTTAKCCQKIRSRISPVNDLRVSQGTYYLVPENEKKFNGIRNNSGASNNVENHFCALHDTDLENYFHLFEKQRLLANFNFCKNQLKEKISQAMVTRNPNHVALRRKSLIFSFLSGGVLRVVKNFWRFFFRRKPSQR